MGRGKKENNNDISNIWQYDVSLSAYQMYSKRWLSIRNWSYNFREKTFKASIQMKKNIDKKYVYSALDGSIRTICFTHHWLWAKEISTHAPKMFRIYLIFSIARLTSSFVYSFVSINLSTNGALRFRFKRFKTNHLNITCQHLKQNQRKKKHWTQTKNVERERERVEWKASDMPFNRTDIETKDWVVIVL